jgi:hypothetical protein
MPDEAEGRCHIAPPGLGVVAVMRSRELARQDGNDFFASVSFSQAL